MRSQNRSIKSDKGWVVLRDDIVKDAEKIPGWDQPHAKNNRLVFYDKGHAKVRGKTL